MKVCVIGTGYVGLVVGTCLAEMGNDVICVDKDKLKLAKLKKADAPLYEPSLGELIKKNYAKKRLKFSNDLKSAVREALICYIAVGTPQNVDGNANLEFVYDVANNIGKSLNGYKVIINKSTVPVGTSDKVKEIIKQHTDTEFDVISNPEFLSQGNAVKNFLQPDRIIIGSNSERATDLINELYEPYIKTSIPILYMDVKSAEMTKYAANSFLAVKISYANQIANICEKVGANAEMVRMGMSLDKRIGSQFLYHGIGYGGSCFPKDVKALIKTAQDNNCDYNLLQAADDINKKQRFLFVEKILNRFENIKNKTFAIWGLSFKPLTNDMREAPSVTIINELLTKGAKIKAYDPKALENAKIIFGKSITYSNSAYDVLKNADGLLLLTEWNEFKQPDFDKIKKLLKQPIIFDGRNQYNCDFLKNKGFEYFQIGKDTK